MSPEATGGLDRLLDSLGSDLVDALDRVGLPVYLLDRNGVIRWLSSGAVALVGDVVGHRYLDFLAPEAARRAQQQFAAKLLGTKERTQYEVDLLGTGGRLLRYQIASVPLVQGDRVVGVFGLAYPAAGRSESAQARLEQLTPRQREVLDLLAGGRSTREIAGELGISEETVRNHVRHLLRRLGVRSRLDAVLAVRQPAA